MEAVAKNIIKNGRVAATTATIYFGGSAQNFSQSALETSLSTSCIAPGDSKQKKGRGTAFFSNSSVRSYK